MNKRVKKLLALTVLLAVLGGCGRITIVGTPVIDGSVSIEQTQTRGPVNSTFSDCRSGFHESFLGADLLGDAFSIRVLRTATFQPEILLVPRSPALKQLGNSVELSQANCSALELKVFSDSILPEDIDKPHPTAPILNYTRDSHPTSGKVIFNCNLPTGERISGAVAFQCW